ncbi:MAG: hypothetical protein KGZ94_00530 [Clostridia bacterium]|nr:hypothetical protein [Clostridia bacterium]
MDILWIIIFILYMAYRAFSETQRKQQQAQRRKMTTREDPGTRHYRYEDVEPKQEVPWDFDPDEYQQQRKRSYQANVEEAPQEESIYQKKLKTMGDKKRDKTKKVVEPSTIAEPREPVSAGFSIQLDNKSLVNAVVMSEILQPPRAKRPLRLRY